VRKSSDQTDGRAVHLSPRQAQIVSLIASGCSTKEIAIRLEMSPYTVQCHLDRLFSRYHLHSRARLIASCAPWVAAG
jgi:DNA-binding CsgD family transcriptional regulator